MIESLEEVNLSINAIALCFVAVITRTYRHVQRRHVSPSHLRTEENSLLLLQHQQTKRLSAH